MWLFIYELVIKKQRDNLIALFKRHLALFIVSLILLFFALSNIVTFGSTVLLTIPLPTFIYEFVSIFRASGRFAWIVVYLVFIFVLYMLSRIKVPKIKYLPIVLAAVVFAVQLYDFSGVIGRKQSYFNGEIETDDTQIKTPYFTHSFWDRAFVDFDTFINLEDTSIIVPNGGIELAIRAGKSGGYINASFAARNSNEQMSEYRAATTANLLAGIADENTIYLTSEPEKFAPLVESGYYQMIFTSEQFVLFMTRYTEEELDAFIAEGNFNYWGNEE